MVLYESMMWCIGKRLEIVAETRILVEMKIKNQGEKYFLWEKNQAYFFPMKIKTMDL